MKAHGDLDARVHIFAATALRSAAFTSRKAPGTHFLVGYMDPRTSLDTRHERTKKISTPPTPGIEPGPSSPLSSALPLEFSGPLGKVSTHKIQQIIFHAPLSTRNKVPVGPNLGTRLHLS